MSSETTTAVKAATPQPLPARLRVRRLPALLLGLLLAAPPLGAQDPAARRLFASAERLAASGDPTAALEEYTILLRQFPVDALAPAALLRSAELLRQAGDEAASQAALEELTTRHGRSPEAAEAFVLQAEIELDSARDAGDLEAVRKAFRRVPILYGRDLHPDLEARPRALLRAGQLGLRLGDPAGAAPELLAAIEDEPPGPWTIEARLALGLAFQRSGEVSAALELLQRVVEAAEADDDAAAAAAGRHAGRLLGLLERRLLAPAAGERPFSRASSFGLAHLGLRGVESVAAADDGRLLVIDSRQQMVALLAPDGRLLERRDLRGAERAWFGLAGEPYVVTAEAVVQPFSGARIQFADPTADEPRNLGDLLVAERSALGQWALVARKTRGLLTFHDRRGGRADLLATADVDLVDLARDGNGRLLVLEAEGDRILRLEPGRTSSVVARGAWKRPIALAVDDLGTVFLLDRGERRLTVFGPEGEVLAALGPELGAELALRNPVDVAVDGRGRVYIADTKLPFLVRLE